LAAFCSTNKPQRKKGEWGHEDIAFCWGISIIDASKPALKEKNCFLSLGRNTVLILDLPFDYRYDISSRSAILQNTTVNLAIKTC